MHHIHDAIQGYAVSIKEYVDHGFEPEDVGVRFSPIEGLAQVQWLTFGKQSGVTFS